MSGGGSAWVEAVVLAAGSSRRMEGRDKLLEPVRGRPVIALAAAAAVASTAGRVLVVLPPRASDRRAALAGLPVEIVEADDCAEGMSASLRSGVELVSKRTDAVAVLLADMPEVTADHVNRVIAAFDPAAGREIVRAVDAVGRPGHPVLFGRRFFPRLATLTGDGGARAILREAGGCVVDVRTPGRGATLDLDTPAAWAAWREEAGG